MGRCCGPYWSLEAKLTVFSCSGLLVLLMAPGTRAGPGLQESVGHSGFRTPLEASLLQDFLSD